MERKKGLFLRNYLFVVILVLYYSSDYVEGIRRHHRRPPHPLVKVGSDVISLKMGPRAQTVDIAPLLSAGDEETGGRAKTAYPSNGLFVIRRKSPRNYNGYRYNWRQSGNGQENRRSYDTSRAYSALSSSDKSKMTWLALQSALQRQRAIKSQYYGLSSAEKKSEYYRSLLPLLYHYKLQKQAANKYYAKYLRSLQLLALATAANQPLTVSNSPELAQYAQSFKNSPYGSLLNNSSFVSTNSVIESSTEIIQKLKNGTEVIEDQIAEANSANDRSDPHYHLHPDPEYTSFQREIEHQKRRLLDVFAPPQADNIFAERTILMVRFPPVPEKKTKEIIKLQSTYDIDGGITFGGPRWLSFGTPFDPWDHPWNHPTESPKEKEPQKLVLAEADKPSSYGVIISQNFIHTPSIRLYNSDPRTLAKNQGDLLNGGPSIVAQLAKALAEGNRISNSYFLSKNVLEGKKWASPEKKPPFVMVHLDTYTKRKNETGSLGLSEDVEANYANGTIIYPTINNPHILASTKFEFHDAHGIDNIFDKPLVILGNGYGWGEVPVYPKGIREIQNFLRLMYKVHQESHERGKGKIVDLKTLGDKLERPAFSDSKPLLHDQIADRSVHWLHTSTVGIRSLSEDDDQFPYAKHPVVDVTKDYDGYL